MKKDHRKKEEWNEEWKWIDIPSDRWTEMEEREKEWGTFLQKKRFSERMCEREKEWEKESEKESESETGIKQKSVSE